VGEEGEEDGGRREKGLAAVEGWREERGGGGRDEGWKEGRPEW